MHTYIHACMHPCIHPSMHACMHPYIHTSIHPSIHIINNMTMNILNLHIQNHTMLYIYIYNIYIYLIHTHIHTHTYIYIFIYTGANRMSRRCPKRLKTAGFCWYALEGLKACSFEGVTRWHSDKASGAFLSVYTAKWNPQFVGDLAFDATRLQQEPEHFSVFFCTCWIQGSSGDASFVW